jgi:hypothetical protein
MLCTPNTTLENKICCSGILRSIDRWLRIVLGQPIGPISKGQAIQEYETNVSEQHICPISKGQAVQEYGITILLCIKTQKSTDLIYIAT